MYGQLLTSELFSAIMTRNSILNKLLYFLAVLLMITAGCFGMSASKPVDDFVAAPTTHPSSVSVYIYDLREGRLTEGYNENKPLIPASITKALTIATALRETGTDYTYRTRVYTDGSIDTCVLNGNVIVFGSGDPTLNVNKEPYTADFVTETVNALKKKNIRKINGQILFDQSIYPLPAHPASWGSGNKAQDYGAGCFGFNFENNARGGASVSNPAAAFETRLRSALSREGISIAGNELEQGKRHLLFEHVSAPMDEIMRACIRRSENMFAESILRTYAMLNGKEATPDAGSALEMEYWRRRGLDIENVRVVDGSGLSRENRLTAKFLGEVLRKMAGDADYVSFFPLAGQEGTLRSFLKGTSLDSYIALKTGSMNGVQCYAGYKLDYDYQPTHVVVVMVNNMTAPRRSLRRSVEKMLLGIFGTDAEKGIFPEEPDNQSGDGEETPENQ